MPSLPLRPSVTNVCAPSSCCCSRQSANLLQEPAPDGAELDLILDAGLRAPDHGRLRPWRFVLIRGEQRQAWADRLAAAAMARDPENGPAMAEKSRAWVGRTPLIIAIGVEMKEGKIPEIEQVLSAGAAAMNMLNAIHLLGYGGMWVTGANSYDPQVNKALGFEAPSRLRRLPGRRHAEGDAGRRAQDRASLARSAHHGVDGLILPGADLQVRSESSTSGPRATPRAPEEHEQSGGLEAAHEQERQAVLIQTALTLRYSSTCCRPLSRP